MCNVRHVRHQRETALTSPPLKVVGKCAHRRHRSNQIPRESSIGYPLPRKCCLAKECCHAAPGGCSVHTAAGASPLGARLPRRAAAPRRELSGKLRVDRQPATSPPPRATTHVRDKLMVHDKKVGPVRKNQGCGSVRGPTAPARMAELPDGPVRGRSRRDPDPSEQRRPARRGFCARAGLAAPRRRDAARGEEGGGDARSRCARHTSACACRAQPPHPAGAHAARAQPRG
jgi:hypothetical protein